MPLTRQLALVCEPAKNTQIEFRQLASVCAALQRQITEDFSPIWEISATIDPFERLEDVPLGYWPIIVEDDIDSPGAAGVHEHRMGQPFALVTAGMLWSLTASHEALEMLVDPSGNRTIFGPPPKGAEGAASSTVEFLVEICDPCEDLHNAYTVNSIPVSDFYTPNYFDAHPSNAVRYDFTGKIKEPREVLEYGYLTWHNPVDDEWYQWRKFGPTPFARLGKLADRRTSMRSIVDKHTKTPLEEDSLWISQESRLDACPALCAEPSMRPRSQAGCWRKKSGKPTARRSKTAKEAPAGGHDTKAPVDGLREDVQALRNDIENILKKPPTRGTPPSSGKNPPKK